DVLMLPGTPLDTLDFTSFTMNLGSKLILDCTSQPGGLPRPPQAKPAAAKAARKFDPAAIRRAVGSAYAGHVSLEDALLVVKLKNSGKPGAAQLKKLLQAPLGPHKWAALVSDDVDLDDTTSLIWGLFTRFDAARDLQFTRSQLYQAWPLHQGVMGIDATW